MPYGIPMQLNILKLVKLLGDSLDHRQMHVTFGCRCGQVLTTYHTWKTAAGASAAPQVWTAFNQDCRNTFEVKVENMSGTNLWIYGNIWYFLVKKENPWFTHRAAKTGACAGGFGCSASVPSSEWSLGPLSCLRCHHMPKHVLSLSTQSFGHA